VKHDIVYLFSATFIMFSVTFLLRGFPFLAFSKKNSQPPKIILYIGKFIGPAIMAMLIVYCLKNTNFIAHPYGIPEVSAVCVCTILHLWKRNPIISIVSSTAVYMSLLNLLN